MSPKPTGHVHGNDLILTRMPLSDRKLAGDVGPGWEYYLDMLVAAREGEALPSFDDYYPAQRAHYLEGA